MMHKNRTISAVLSVAGSDPSGGAGIQADLKTLAIIGVYGGAVVTCQTIQNTRGVQAVIPQDPVLVRSQIEQVLCDLSVSHIKIGMVGTAAMAAAVSKALAGYDGEVVCDPVLVASSGTPLLDDMALETYYREILGCATVLTPNLDELQTLTGLACPTENEQRNAARQLFDRYGRVRAIIVKGGHGDPTAAAVTDRLYQRHTAAKTGALMQSVARSHARIKTKNSHGTGCTFATAFAGYHQQCGNDQLAFERSVDLLERLLQQSTPFQVGHGRGPLLHHLACNSG